MRYHNKQVHNTVYPMVKVNLAVVKERPHGNSPLLFLYCAAFFLLIMLSCYLAGLSNLRGRISSLLASVSNITSYAVPVNLELSLGRKVLLIAILKIHT